MLRKREYKDKQGQQIWGYDFWHNGVRYRKSGFITKAESEIAEMRARRRVFSGKPVMRPSTFAELVGPFLDHRRNRVAANTFSRDERRIPTLVRHLGDTRTVLISEADINGYMDTRLKDGMSARTVNLEINLLSSIFQYAAANGYAYENPTKGVKRLKTTQVERRIPTEEEFRSVVQAARTMEHGLQLATWITLRGYTGTRPGESYFLEWRDIDFKDGVINIRPKDGNPLKNGKARVVNMHSELRTLLAEWKQEWDRIFAGKKPPHDWVFIHPDFPERRCQRFEKSFPRAQKLAGLKEKITPHALRHFFISQAVMSGVSMLTISRWVGHSSYQMIERVYAHLSPEFRKGEMEKMQFAVTKSEPSTPCEQKIVPTDSESVKTV